ncbi:inositol polyphosphate kinase family protein [Vibrio mangrovi]|uniref:Inositol polyphosphate kinase n=1 Tax=Vibrio mangrovi TaxID=474394 RepID=A0A1Y6J0J2_9VIBR|nr:inositol polyphosphate kinase family protein [Vibrio mangrovi]MDW6002760.1 inositol polyphosphate kinase family protein [Vibrio mangrovi]SMS02252.1 Inositol polyphosphate kinase [Vibrio mangrovi]
MSISTVNHAKPTGIRPEDVTRNNKQHSIEDIAWQKIRHSFCSTEKKAAVACLHDIMYNTENISVNGKLIAFERLQRMAGEGHKSRFQSEISATKDPHKHQLTLRLDDMVILSGEYKKHGEPSFKIAAGHKLDFSYDQGALYKIVSDTELKGYNVIPEGKEYHSSGLSKAETIPEGLRTPKPGETVIRMNPVGAGIKHTENVGYYDFKLGRKSAVSQELKANHGLSTFKSKLKELRHEILLDERSASHSHHYRLEGSKANQVTDKHLNRNSTVNAFRNMLLNVPEKHQDAFFHQLTTQLNERLDFMRANDQVTFVGSSLLIAAPEYPKTEYPDMQMDAPEVKFIDFAHPIRQGDKKFTQQRASVIHGIENMIRDLETAFRQ